MVIVDDGNIAKALMWHWVMTYVLSAGTMAHESDQIEGK
jgi:hypothetical protein